MKIPKNSLEQPFIMEIRNRVMHIESPLTLPPDPGSVIKAIKRVNLQIKTLQKATKEKGKIINC